MNDIERALVPLYKQQESINKKIRTLCNAKAKLCDEEATAYISKIPNDICRITDTQWEWILRHDRMSDSTTRYKYCKEKLFYMGFEAYGLHPETSQWDLSINMYSFNASNVKKSFKILRKYIKPLTADDPGHCKEIGICLKAYGLREDMTSVLYVHSVGDVTLYLSSNKGDVKTFKSFDVFVDWYKEHFKKEL
jgi:hypothetical protein